MNLKTFTKLGRLLNGPNNLKPEIKGPNSKFNFEDFI